MVCRNQLKRLALPGAMLVMLSAWVFSPEQQPDCDIQADTCTKKVSGTSITFDITPRPVRHMQELVFSLTVKPCASLPDTLLLDLSMPGMVMGKNQVPLVKKSSCLYQGNGLIVKCKSGRKLWKATVLSEKLNNVAFTFNVRE